MEKQSNVLIVTDRTDAFNSMQRIIHSMNYRFAVADSGTKAINLIQKIQFDIVYLVDITEIDGKDAYYEIKRYSPETIVMKVDIYDRKVNFDEVMANRVGVPEISGSLN